MFITEHIFSIESDPVSLVSFCPRHISLDTKMMSQLEDDDVITVCCDIDVM